MNRFIIIIIKIKPVNNIFFLLIEFFIDLYSKNAIKQINPNAPHLTALYLVDT